MSIKLCWWDSKNFGDALNPYLFKSLGHNVVYAQSNSAEAIAVGSYMERLLLGALFDKVESELPISVWGTGFQFEPGRHLWFKNIKIPEAFIRPIKVYALRGELSKIRTEKITQHRLDDIALGDPGLLASKMFNTRHISKRYRLGVFCHFTDNDNDIFDKIVQNVRDSIRINVEAPVTDIVRMISGCEAIISSAMHPLIIADSLRVPNQWINISENAISKYKFDDYYSVFNIKPQPFELSQRLFDESALTQLHANYTITDDQIKQIQSNLIAARPLPGHFHRLSLTDITALRLREFLIRDKPLQKYSQKIRAALGRRVNFIRS